MARRVWLQNALRSEIIGLSVDDLSTFTYRKGYCSRWYDVRPGYIEIGLPKGNLDPAVYCGLYGYEVLPPEGWERIP